MRMLFREKAFSLRGSYDVYDDAGAVLFQVRGQSPWRHMLEIRDGQGRTVGTVREKVWTVRLKCFVSFEDGSEGVIRRVRPLLRPRYEMDFCGWTAEGNYTGKHYTIRDKEGTVVAQADRVPLHLSDRYVIDVDDPDNTVRVLMFMLAAQVEKAEVACCA